MSLHFGRTATRRHGVAAAVAVALLAGLLAACAPDPVAPSEPDAYALRSSIGAGAITLTWSAPSAEAASYEVASLVGSGGWETFDTVASTTTEFEVTHRSDVRFRVRALDADGVQVVTWSKPLRVVYVDTVLPTLRIDTQNAAPILDRDNYVPATVSLDPNGSGFAAYTGTAGIRGRGNSTWSYAKKPYRLKLDTKSPMMGLATERDWALLANAVDESQLRNYLATEASRMTSLAYSPTMRHIEVILNGSYAGVYTLTQHNELGKDRVNITEMDEDDNEGEALTGGYRLEIDARLEENNEPGFRTAKNVPVVVKDPDPMTPQQRTYIRGLVQSMEDALFGPNFTDPVNGYRKYIDMESYVDHFIVQELTYNQDTFFSSTFFTKERGEDKIKSGPVWDFDNAIGNNRGTIDDTPIGDWARTRGIWNQRIFLDPATDADIAQRWQELRPLFAELPGMALAKGAEIEPAIASDLFRWGLHDVRPNDEPQYIADWLTQRIAWMDSRYPAPAED